MSEVLGVPAVVLFGQLLIGLINGAFYALLSLGVAVIFGMLRVANFMHGAQFMLRTGDHVVLCGSGGPGDARTAMLRGGLERLGCSVSAAALEDGTDGLAAAMRAGLAAQALCLAVAEARGLDVTEPAGGSGAAEVQSDWFGWSSD